MSNEIKTAIEVVTWTDGHGRWHAEVPEGAWSASRASNIIALEIWERSNKSEQSFKSVRNYVEEHLTKVSNHDGRVHFAEYSI